MLGNMNSNLINGLSRNLSDIITSYTQGLYSNPSKLIVLLIDIGIVLLLFTKLFKIVRDSRAWQLLKGIALIILFMALSSFLHLDILNYVLTSFMTYGVVLVVLFQPELRRSLEELGSNKITRFFGIDKDIETKTKEEIYKVAIAAFELAKSKIGALIVLERDIEIKDIIATGVVIDSEISPQLIVNIFVPNTPLHDGAIVVSGGRIKAAACMLPLAGDKDIARELGTRHRAAIGISKESDAIAVVVSEETGKVSIAKDGVLIADLKEEALKKILIKNLITKRYIDNNSRISEIQKKFKRRKKEQKVD